jgi:hypothetical protein
MCRAKRMVSVVLASGLAIAAPALTFAADLKSPDSVNMGLRILASVYGDMDRKLAADQFDRLPHENQEMQEGSGALRDAIANEPADFKARVEASLKNSLTASTHVADVSATHDKAQVKSALDALATSLRNLNALFPEGLRTEPGTVAPGRAGAPHGAPPKGP